MEFLVTMTTHVPAGTSDDAVADIRRREAGHSRELAEQGRLLRLWRPPLAPGEWRTLGLFAAADAEELEQTLASMPLRIWRSDDVAPLARHPNDPPPEHRTARGGLPEFFTTFTVEFPPGTSSREITRRTLGEAERTKQLSAAGSLVRLWRLLDTSDRPRALGLWRAADPTALTAVLASLPMAEWLTIVTTPLTAHPNDPVAAELS
jgi:muconolactone delta-isomerase